ncbi:hypothetical protein FOZ61_004399 [Perkinsus olseni]|uniref:Uncharacterized protein n=1 Tax=Perkinsus olseni TaxID=32597 RepID=A0A7J6LYN8_PEROL|nr:hypothetical protein FOZ61_004399 [Perkinsus olseni]KAF4664402.1 hypothetical protein FOL46_004262 [Perkinsus olseni]
MALVINMLSAIAAFVAIVGTTTPNATTSPSPDPLRPGPSGDDLGDRLWWLLAEREIEGLLKEEQQAAGGPLHGVEIPLPPTVGSSTSTTTTTTSSPTTSTSGPEEGQLRGGTGSSTSASYGGDNGAMVAAVLLELAIFMAM